MMNKFILFNCLFISFYSIATSSMNEITRHAYLDNDNIKDKIVCGKDISNEESYAPTYECQITTKSINVFCTVTNNNECSDYNIDSNVKGEFYIQCGTYGKDISYYYKFDEKLKNWFLFKIKTEFLPMSGDYEVQDIQIEEPKEQWSIDKKKLKINN